MNDKENRASVALALDLTAGQNQMLIGNVPDDEELAAFYEGGLDPARRAQIVGFLANDEASYRKWLGLVEVGDTLGLKDQHVNAKEPRASFIGSAIDAIKTFFNSKTYVSAVAFSAVAVVALVFQLNKSELGVDHLYTDYGTDYIDNAFQLPARGFNLNNSPIENEAIVISQGVYNGLVSLDEATSVPGLHIHSQSISKAKQTLSEQDVQVYLELGRWAAISYYQCAGNNAEFIVASQQVLVGINNKVSAINSDFATSVNALYAQLKIKNANTQVCDFAKNIVDKKSQY